MKEIDEVFVFLNDVEAHSGIVDFSDKVASTAFLRSATISHIAHIFNVKRSTAMMYLDMWIAEEKGRRNKEEVIA